MSAVRVHCFSSTLPFPLGNMFLCAHCIWNPEQPVCKMHHSVKMKLPVRHWASISVLESVTVYFCRREGDVVHTPARIRKARDLR